MVIYIPILHSKMSKIVKRYVFWNHDITFFSPRENCVLAISLRREMYTERIRVTIRARYNGVDQK